MDCSRSENGIPGGAVEDFCGFLVERGWKEGDSILSPIPIQMDSFGRWSIRISRTPRSSELSVLRQWSMNYALLEHGDDMAKTVEALGPECVVYSWRRTFRCPFCDELVHHGYHKTHEATGRSRAKKAE